MLKSLGCAFVVMSACGTVYAQGFCGPLDGFDAGVGEGRWALSSAGVHELYSNAYYDGGHELSIHQGTPLGWLSSGGYFDLGVNVFLADRDVDTCDIGWVRLNIFSDSGTCGPGTYRGFAEYKVNSCSLDPQCSPPEECTFYGGRFIKRTVLESWGDIYYQVCADDLSSSQVCDTGCFGVGSGASSCY